VTIHRVGIVGDFHLGRPNAPLACRVPSEELLAAVDALASRCDLVVINGDFYDLERGVLPSQRLEAMLVRETHAVLEDALSGPKFIWTSGNHDRALGHAVSAELNTGAGTLRVEHGDRFDPPIKRLRGFTTLVTWASGRAHATPALTPAYRALRRMESVLTGSESSRELDPVTRAAVRWLDEDGSPSMLAIGHTHVPTLLTTPRGRLLMNPGASVDQVRALEVDAAAGEARLLVYMLGAFRVVDVLALPSPATALG
jgi:predicted phosphodiesterase